jgi:hypothetical protein
MPLTLTLHRLGLRGRWVPRPQLNEVAKAHHCLLVVSFVADEDSNQAAPFGLPYEFHHGPPKTLRAAWRKLRAENLNRPVAAQ